MPEDPLDTQTKSAAVGRRLRGLSREIGFAVLVTIAALLSVFGSLPHDSAKTASIVGNPAVPVLAVAP